MFSSCRHRDNVYVSCEESALNSSDGFSYVWRRAAPYRQQSCATMDQQASTFGVYHYQHPHPWYQCEFQQDTAVNDVSPHYHHQQHHHHQQLNHQLCNRVVVPQSSAAVPHGYHDIDTFFYLGRSAAPVSEYCHALQYDRHPGMMTSSQCSWPGWTQHQHVPQGGFDTGSRSAPHRFRSDELVASMVRRDGAPESTGGGEPATAAYDRRMAAVETERQHARASGSDHDGHPHDEAPFDHVDGRLIDFIDASLGPPSTSAHDLRTAVSLTAANTAPVSNVSPLLRHVTNSLKTSHHQVSIDSHPEVDEQITSLLLRTVSRSNGHGVIDDDDDEAFSGETSWSSVVDLTSSPSVQWPADPATALRAADGPPALPDAVSSTAVPRRRRRRQPHTKAAVDRLKAWYDEHRSRPYASDAEVQRLAMECELGVRQVQKWLSNRRRMDGNTRRRNRPAHNAKLGPAVPASATH